MQQQPPPLTKADSEPDTSVSATAKLHQAPPQKPFTARAVLRSLGSKFVLVGLIALVITAICWHWISEKTLTAQGLSALSLAYRDSRPTEPRISGFSYAPRLTTRGNEQKIDYAARDRAERLLLDAANEEPGPKSHHALGKLYLAAGDADKAVHQFQLALAEDANNSKLKSDLGAAVFEISQKSIQAGKPERSLEFLARSLEHTDNALQIDPGNVEALFNRALILSHLTLIEQGKLAWQSYLAQETQPDWASDAKANLNRLVADAPATAAEIVDGFVVASESKDAQRAWLLLSRNREMIARKFIPQELARAYLRALSETNPKGASRFLSALEYAGKLDLEKANDPFVSQIAGYYSRLGPAQRALLADAHSSQVAGYQSILNSHYADALVSFTAARNSFNRAGDEWEARICDYWIGYCESQHDHLAKSTAVLTSLADYSQRRNFSWLWNQATSWLANNETEMGEHSKSVETYKKSLSVADALEDNYLRQKILSQLGNEYNLLGQPQLALEYDWRSLHVTEPRFISVRQMWRNYLYTTRALVALHLYHAANAYGSAMLNLAENNIKESDIVNFSLLYLAQIKAGEKNIDEGVRLASRSLELAQSLADEKTRRKLSGFSLRLIAHLQRQSGDFTQALATYDRAFQSQQDSVLYTYDVRKGKLLCYAAMHDRQSFETELPLVLDQYEKYRSKIQEEQNRNTFFDNEQSVYDLAIQHAYENGDALAALTYSEESRARSLLASLTKHDQVDSKAGDPDKTRRMHLDLERVKTQMPANAQLLEYSVLSDRIVIWLITKDSIRDFTRSVSAEDLNKQISTYVESLTAGPNRKRELNAAARNLYDLLLDQVAGLLDSQKVLCVIPDKALSYLPFATLVSRRGQYLISEFALVYSPSLNVFLRCTEAGALRDRDKRSETLVDVGNPSFDPRDYPDLPNLPAAEREAREITVNYVKAYPFIGRQAVKSSIEKKLEDADVIHFAAHYLANERYPALSRFVLAKPGGNSPPAAEVDLTANDLAGRNLPRLKLVVLSACLTAGEKYYNGEGLVGISRTFLEAGVPLIVATQWPVESESSAELMIKFHRYRKLPETSSIAALRRAQLEMISDKQGGFYDPYYWAAFVPLGGYADF